MKEELHAMRLSAKERIDAADSPRALEDARVTFLGKKGELAVFTRRLGALPEGERPAAGALIHAARAALEAAFAEKSAALTARAEQEKLLAERLDVTLPGKNPRFGRRHPMSIVLDEVKEVFLGMGYSVAEGPEVETTYYCFDALNHDEHHPARDERDTFYFDCRTILRTQTSSVQIRTMERQKPPIRVISPGKTYRKDETDATHSPLFHQIEGLVVDEGITMGHLKGTLEELMRRIFGPRARLRFRPHHFPYTEPSAEVDLLCFACGGKGCRMCGNEGYIELLGAGMVHPRVLRVCGIDPQRYSGFAFGVGLERLTMMRFEIPDMRLLFENDMRFLLQFDMGGSRP
ncbi:MAG: phenylalanine--tRNA ligase subunit alpha [Oscillospiraceae bacterium]|jgi:phenylalanyl-tRNA synthetase alpha chain|nr:phenylalanine--tRNA ligase subunit alpha [Oscillospiraceae bacterium]